MIYMSEFLHTLITAEANHLKHGSVDSGYLIPPHADDDDHLLNEDWYFGLTYYGKWLCTHGVDDINNLSSHELHDLAKERIIRNIECTIVFAVSVAWFVKCLLTTSVVKGFSGLIDLFLFYLIWFIVWNMYSKRYVESFLKTKVVRYDSANAKYHTNDILSNECSKFIAIMKGANLGFPIMRCHVNVRSSPYNWPILVIDYTCGLGDPFGIKFILNENDFTCKYRLYNMEGNMDMITHKGTVYHDFKDGIGQMKRYNKKIRKLKSLYFSDSTVDNIKDLAE